MTEEVRAATDERTGCACGPEGMTLAHTEKEGYYDIRAQVDWVKQDSEAVLELERFRVTIPNETENQTPKHSEITDL